jgi:glycosyltransferase involved in cell wall biosynthesis
VVVPRIDGHYLRYVDLIKQEYPDLILLVASDRNWKSFFKLFWFHTREFWKPKNKRGSFIYLHGEGQILCALLSSAVFWIPTRMLFYYGFTSERSFSYTSLAGCVLAILKLVDVRLCYLEYSTNIVHERFWRYFSYVPDTPLDIREIYPPVGYSGAGVRRVLLAGAIDERKNYALLCETLGNLCSRYSNLRVELLVVGEQSEKALKFFNNQKLHKNIDLLVNNSRVSNEELAASIIKSDVIWVFYESHRGSSGMFLNAVAAGKKVIYRPFGVVANFGIELGILPPVLPSDAVDVEQWLLDLLLEDAPQYTAEAQRRFISARSERVFLRTLCQKL